MIEINYSMIYHRIANLNYQLTGIAIPANQTSILEAFGKIKKIRSWWNWASKYGLGDKSIYTMFYAL